MDVGKLVRSQPTNTRLALSVGLFIFALAGNFAMGKLETEFPVQEPKMTVSAQDRKRIENELE